MLSYLLYQVVNLAVTIAVPAASYVGIRYVNDRLKQQRERLKRELQEHEIQQHQLELQLQQQQRQQKEEWLLAITRQAVKFSEQKYKHQTALKDVNSRKLESAIDFILRNISSAGIDIQVDEELARDKIEVVLHDLNMLEDEEP
jgi:histidyl-tRNA synthetase